MELKLKFINFIEVSCCPCAHYYWNSYDLLQYGRVELQCYSFLGLRRVLSLKARALAFMKWAHVAWVSEISG